MYHVIVPCTMYRASSLDFQGTTTFTSHHGRTPHLASPSFSTGQPPFSSSTPPHRHHQQHHHHQVAPCAPMASTEEFWAARRARESEELGRSDIFLIILVILVFFYNKKVNEKETRLYRAEQYYFISIVWVYPDEKASYAGQLVYKVNPSGGFSKDEVEVKAKVGEVKEVKAKVGLRGKARTLEILLWEQGSDQMIIADHPKVIYNKLNNVVIGDDVNQGGEMVTCDNLEQFTDWHWL